jgi:hypothetical protein
MLKQSSTTLPPMMWCHIPEDPILFCVSNLHFTRDSKKCSDTIKRKLESNFIKPQTKRCNRHIDNRVDVQSSLFRSTHHARAVQQHAVKQTKLTLWVQFHTTLLHSTWLLIQHSPALCKGWVLWLLCYEQRHILRVVFQFTVTIKRNRPQSHWWLRRWQRQ